MLSDKSKRAPTTTLEALQRQLGQHRARISGLVLALISHDTHLHRLVSQSLWQRNLVDWRQPTTVQAIHTSGSLAGYQRNGIGITTRWRHIEHCLGMFEQCKSAAAGIADAVELAIWMHDVILESGRRDNEARSAQLYLELSAGAFSSDANAPADRLRHDHGDPARRHLARRCRQLSTWWISTCPASACRGKSFCATASICARKIRISATRTMN